MTRRTFNPNVKNVANQTGFYNFVTSAGEKATIETFFNDTETKMKYAAEALIGRPTASTLLEYRLTLAKFIALQEERTPIFRDTHNHTVRLANENLKPDGFEFETPTENDTREFQARFLSDFADYFASILLKMKWILVTNKSDKPFWTSDNPTFRYNPIRSKFFGNLGIESKGIQLHIPISSALAIIICDPLEYADIASVLPAFAPSVDFNNSGQVIHSRQYVFSPRDNFALAHEMISKDPELSNPNRPRIVIGH